MLRNLQKLNHLWRTAWIIKSSSMLSRKCLLLTSSFSSALRIYRFSWFRMTYLSWRKLSQHSLDKRKETYQAKALSQPKVYSIWFLHLVTQNWWWKTASNTWLQLHQRLIMIHSSMMLCRLIVRTSLIWWSKEAWITKSRKLEISMKFKKSLIIRSIMFKNQT
jgi:hypothetical protein